jgi:hypothetical protein
MVTHRIYGMPSGMKSAETPLWRSDVFKRRNLVANQNSETEIIRLISKIGRHDWTRTNDPHHVKVVL